MPGRIISNIPNILTLCNLLSGCIAIVMSFHSADTYGPLTGLQWCWIAIAAAAAFDFCDGASARGLHAYSPLGADLDSLSDLVSFGVAPAMMMFNVMTGAGTSAGIALATMLIPVAGAYRLAKFNNDTTQTTTFRGLPIPANAIFWIGMCGWIQRYIYPGPAVIILFVLILSWLMVCNIRMFSLKFKTFGWHENFRRYVLLAASVLFLVTWHVAGFVWIVALYVFISVLGRKEQETV